MSEIDDAAVLSEPAGTRAVELSSTAEITELLSAWKADPAAGEALMKCVYGELRRLAAVQLGRAGSPLSWQPTELVHELYLKLTDRREALTFANRAHFYGVMARLLRDLTVDRARHQQRLKRGGATAFVSLGPHTVSRARFDPQAVDLLALDRALARLEQVRASAARVVELRFFAGLTIPETAEVLGVDRSTVGRTWRYARAWLRQALEESASMPGRSRR